MPEQKYSIEEFGQKIKEKYPEYENIDNVELGKKILEKYPEYSDRINVGVNKQSNISPKIDTQNYNSTQQPQQSDGFLKSLARSVVSPVAKLATSAKNVAASTGKLLTGDVQGAGQELNKSRNFSIPILPGMAGINLGKFDPAFTGQETTAGAAKKMTGYGAEIASTIAPVGNVGKGAKLLKTAGKFGTVNVVGNLGNQLQGDQPINVNETIQSGLLGAALPIAGRGASKLIKGVGNVGSEILGKTTGTSADVIKEAFNNPNVVKFARQAGTKGGADLQLQALEEAQQGLKQIVQKKGNEYVSELEKIKTSGPEVQQVLDSTRNNAKQLLSDFDIKIQEGKKLNNLNFDNSTITKNKEIVQKAFNDVMSWRDTSAAGIDRLKKRLSQYANDIPATERGGAYNFIMDLQNSVKSGLNEFVPGYKEMTSKYAQASDLIEEIEKALSLKDTASQDTAIRKLMSTVRDNNDLRKEFVDVLSGASGKDIRGKLAGSALSPGLARGLSGKIAQVAIGGAGVAHFLNPSAVPLLGLYVSASSPRLVAEFTSLLNKVTKPMIKANKFSSQIQNGLRVLLQRSLNEN